MQELTPEESAKNKALFEAENERRYTPIGPTPQQSRRQQRPSFASEKEAERAAIRGLKWLRNNPHVKPEQIPGHIREKLAIAKHMMGIQQ